jgi:hypothetical protein
MANIRGSNVTTTGTEGEEPDLSDWNQLPELGPPPILVELILGGQSQIVALEQVD